MRLLIRTTEVVDIPRLPAPPTVVVYCLSHGKTICGMFGPNPKRKISGEWSAMNGRCDTKPCQQQLLFLGQDSFLISVNAEALLEHRR